MLSSTTKLIAQGAVIIGGIISTIGTALKLHNDYRDAIDYELACDDEKNIVIIEEDGSIHEEQ